jgi:hypothetical protein
MPDNAEAVSGIRRASANGIACLGTFGHPEKIQLLQPSTAQCFRLCDSVCHSEYIHRKIAGILNAGPLRHSEHWSCRNGALHANFTTNLPFSKKFTQIEC